MSPVHLNYTVDLLHNYTIKHFMQSLFSQIIYLLPFCYIYTIPAFVTKVLSYFWHFTAETPISWMKKLTLEYTWNIETQEHIKCRQKLIHA